MKSEYSAADCQASYQAWLKTLVEQLGSSGELHRKITQAKYGDPEWAELRSVSSQTVRNWVNRGSLPSAEKTTVISRLDELVETNVKKIPDKAIPLSFSDTVSLLRQHRDKNSKIENDEVSLIDEDYVVYEPELIANFDLNATRLLGSRLNNGAVPTYCQRDADSQIIRALNDANKPLVLISGPPKSGKTRSLLENLKLSTLGNAKLFWANPFTESIDALIEKLDPNHNQNTVVVLDDLQRFNFGHFGLDLKKMKLLQARSKVVGTVHDSILERWNLAQSEFKDSQAFLPSPRLAEHFKENAIGLDNELSQQELLTAETTLGMEIEDATQLRFLPAYMASVDALIKKAEVLRTGTIYESQLIESLLECRLLYPDGFELDELKEINKADLTQRFPTNIWDDGFFRDALQAVTQPLTRGAPHAILTRTLDNENHYSLSDFVWEAFRLKKFSWQHLDLEKFDIGTLATTCFYEGIYDATKSLLESKEDELESFEFGLLGLANQYLGRPQDAEKYFRRSINEGSFEFAGELLDLMLAQGRNTEAYDLVLSIAESDLDESACNVGGLACRAVNDFNQAAIFWKKFPNSPDCLDNLGALEYYKGNVALSEQYFRQAIECSDNDGSSKARLAHTLFSQRRTSEALELIEDIKDDNIFATYVYASHLYDSNQYADALSYFSRVLAFKLESIERNQFVGEAFGEPGDQTTDLETKIAFCKIQLGEIDNGLTELKKLSTLGSSRASYSYSYFSLKYQLASSPETELLNMLRNGRASSFLADLDYLDNYRKIAYELLDKLTKENDLDALLVTAQSEEYKGNTENALNLYKKTLKLGHTPSELEVAYLSTQLDPTKKVKIPKLVGIDVIRSNILGLIHRNVGNLSEAKRCFEHASVGGNEEAAVNLSLVLMDEGRLDEAQEILERHQHFAMAINNLGAIAERKGQTKKARGLYKRSLALGVSLAGTNLAILEAKQKNPKEAIRQFEKTIKLGNAGAITNLVMYAAFFGNQSDRSRISKLYVTEEYQQLFEVLSSLAAGERDKAHATLKAEISEGANDTYDAVADMFDFAGESHLAVEYLKLFPDRALEPRLNLASRLWGIDTALVNRILDYVSSSGYNDPLGVMAAYALRRDDCEIALAILERIKETKKLTSENKKLLSLAQMRIKAKLEMKTNSHNDGVPLE